MTKKIEQYLNEHQHKEIIDIIFQRMIDKNKPENFKDVQIPSLMSYIAFQILKPSQKYHKEIINNEDYILEFLSKMKGEFDNV